MIDKILKFFRLARIPKQFKATGKWIKPAPLEVSEHMIVHVVGGGGGGSSESKNKTTVGAGGDGEIVPQEGSSGWSKNFKVKWD